jgi:hypothetical protein
MKPQREKQSEDLAILLRILHLHLDARREGKINISGRSAIVKLIQAIIDNGGNAGQVSAWDTYYSIFELHQEKDVPFWLKNPRVMHRKIDRYFTKKYNRFFFDRDIIQFYVEVIGPEAEERMKKYQNEERSVSNERT